MAGAVNCKVEVPINVRCKVCDHKKSLRRAGRGKHKLVKPEDRKRYKKTYRDKNIAAKKEAGTYRLRLCDRPAAQVGTNNYRVAKNFGSYRGRITTKQWRFLRHEWLHCCAICDEELPLAIDHIIPLTLGGMNTIDNIQPLCIECNSRKGNKLPIAA